MFDPVQPNIELLRDVRRLRIDGSDMVIGARAFDVLAYLDAHSGRVVTKAELLEHVWADLNVEESNLTVQIAALRKLIGARGFATVPGVGYQLTLSAKAPEEPPKALPLPDKPSLAVLPFANLTGDAGKDYLVDGIVSDLISALSCIRAFFVIASSSTFTLKGKAIDLADVGRQLGVRYIVEGGIQQAGDSLRINVQLVEAETGHLIWSQRFTGSLAQIFELQDSVVAATASAIEPSVLTAEALRADQKPTTSLTAYDLCLRATPAAIRVHDAAAFFRARDQLHQALALDPHYVHAKGLLCGLHIGALSIRVITFAEARSCLPLAEEILSDDRIVDPQALADAGIALAFFGGQQQRGVSALRRAVALNPNSSLVLMSSGWAHRYVGENAIAEEHLLRAIRLNPIDPNIGLARTGLADLLHLRGDYEAAIRLLERAVADHPRLFPALLGLVVSCWKVGRIAEAGRYAEGLRALVPGLSIAGYLRDTPDMNPAWLQDIEDALRAVGFPE
ncbi:MAG: winged helix-turn-helix domain-containing protein [Tabrizicola sp.]|uniref:winged helix-turn-helix domain-containing protein n=1 Tax=Tabrizicola sp. TaxID=2005166 RepID=UPI00273508AD|nr:winged helix-turn-helix domain-containing protein [Tabrizicola sp.]MDP3262729.1 winged helix-turn-helix domain-containing protein [Tabrizicola sp.]